MGKVQCIVNKKTVTLLGINSLFGRITSLLLKQSNAIKSLSLYDDKDVTTACDVAIINTPCKVRAFQGRDQLPCALKNSDIILIGDNQNYYCDSTEVILDKAATRILDIGKVIAESCTNAVILVAANPINCTLPLLSEVLTHYNAYNCNKVLGVTSADNIRANSILATHLKHDARKVVLPVVGGNSAETRVPIFSQARPQVKIPQKVIKKITKEIKNADGKIFNAKNEMEAVNKAYAAARFVHSVLAALRGEPDIAEIALIRSVLVPGTDYFALPFILGPYGIEYRFPLPELTAYESKILCRAVDGLYRDIKKTEKYLSSKEKGHDVSVVDCKEKNLIIDNLFQNYRSNKAFANKAKVEYLLMTNKPIMHVPAVQQPALCPVPAAVVPFEQCYEGCNPIELPFIPIEKRRTPLCTPCEEPQSECQQTVGHSSVQNFTSEPQPSATGSPKSSCDLPVPYEQNNERREPIKYQNSDSQIGGNEFKTSKPTRDYSSQPYKCDHYLRPPNQQDEIPDPHQLQLTEHSHFENKKSEGSCQQSKQSKVATSTQTKQEECKKDSKASSKPTLAKLDSVKQTKQEEPPCPFTTNSPHCNDSSAKLKFVAPISTQITSPLKQKNSVNASTLLVDQLQEKPKRELSEGAKSFLTARPSPSLDEIMSGSKEKDLLKSCKQAEGKDESNKKKKSKGSKKTPSSSQNSISKSSECLVKRPKRFSIGNLFRRYSYVEDPNETKLKVSVQTLMPHVNNENKVEDSSKVGTNKEKLSEGAKSFLTIPPSPLFDQVLADCKKKNNGLLQTPNSKPPFQFFPKLEEDGNSLKTKQLFSFKTILNKLLPGKQGAEPHNTENLQSNVKPTATLFSSASSSKEPYNGNVKVMPRCSIEQSDSRNVQELSSLANAEFKKSEKNMPTSCAISQQYAPKCPPHYLFGEYVKHPIKGENIAFDNVKEMPSRVETSKLHNKISSNDIFAANTKIDEQKQKNSVKDENDALGKMKVVNNIYPKTIQSSPSLSKQKSDLSYIIESKSQNDISNVKEISPSTSEFSKLEESMKPTIKCFMDKKVKPMKIIKSNDCCFLDKKEKPMKVIGNTDCCFTGKKVKPMKIIRNPDCHEKRLSIFPLTSPNAGDPKYSLTPANFIKKQKQNLKSNRHF